MIESLDGATTALQRRVEELTAELERLEMSRSNVVALYDIQKEQLAAERAAREKAEKESAQNLDDAQDLDRKYLYQFKRAERAEKERDDARRRYYYEAQTRQQAERERDAALAQAETALEREVKALQILNIAGERLTQLDADRVAEQARAERAESALDTALARVKELEERGAHVNSEVVRICGEREEMGRRAQAAESALASARETLWRISEWTHRHGDALKPSGADTYGDGMRDAKQQVAGLLSAAPVASGAAKATGATSAEEHIAREYADPLPEGWEYDGDLTLPGYENHTGDCVELTGDSLTVGISHAGHRTTYFTEIPLSIVRRLLSRAGGQQIFECQGCRQSFPRGQATTVDLGTLWCGACVVDAGAITDHDADTREPEPARKESKT